MQAGSLVVCEKNFALEQQAFSIYTYPQKGDILTISSLKKDAINDFYLLHFEELVNIPPTGLCSNCFREIQPPIDLSEIYDLLTVPAKE
jgi:hypothetical protein